MIKPEKRERCKFIVGMRVSVPVTYFPEEPPSADGKFYGRIDMINFNAGFAKVIWEVDAMCSRPLLEDLTPEAGPSPTETPQSEEEASEEDAPPSKEVAKKKKSTKAVEYDGEAQPKSLRMRVAAKRKCPIKKVAKKKTSTKPVEDGSPDSSDGEKILDSDDVTTDECDGDREAQPKSLRVRVAAKSKRASKKLPKKKSTKAVEDDGSDSSDGENILDSDHVDTDECDGDGEAQPKSLRVRVAAKSKRPSKKVPKKKKSTKAVEDGVADTRGLYAVSIDRGGLCADSIDSSGVCTVSIDARILCAVSIDTRGL